HQNSLMAQTVFELANSINGELPSMILDDVVEKDEQKTNFCNTEHAKHKIVESLREGDAKTASDWGQLISDNEWADAATAMKEAIEYAVFLVDKEGEAEKKANVLSSIKPVIQSLSGVEQETKEELLKDVCSHLL